MTSLVAQDLSIGYGSRVLAAKIGMKLEPGTVTCLLGPNGVGKTTLFKTFMGFLPPIAGLITIDGTEPRHLHRRNYAQRVAYVPQAQPQPFAHRVLDLVLMGRTSHLPLLGTPGRADEQIARAALQTLKIDHLAEATINRISGGQLQLTLIARALAQQAGLLIMDEPTASLDFGNSLRVLDHVGKLAEQGLTILMATHDPAQAFAYGHQVALMTREGDCIVGPPRETLTASRLSQAYGVELDIEATISGQLVIVPFARAQHRTEV